MAVAHFLASLLPPCYLMSLLSTVANRAVLLNIEIMKILYSKPFSGSPYCLENKLKTVKMVCMALPLVSAPLFPSIVHLTTASLASSMTWGLPSSISEILYLRLLCLRCSPRIYTRITPSSPSSLLSWHLFMRPPLFKFAVSPTSPCHGPSPAAAFCVLSWHLSFQYVNSSLFWSVFSTARKNKNSVKTKNF